MHLKDRSPLIKDTRCSRTSKKTTKFLFNTIYKPKEQNDRQNINICIRNLYTKNGRKKAYEHFVKKKCTEAIYAQCMTMKKEIEGYYLINIFMQLLKKTHNNKDNNVT
jgi:hypothetical protein